MATKPKYYCNADNYTFETKRLAIKHFIDWHLTEGNMDTNQIPSTDGLDAITRAYLEGGRLASDRAKVGSY